MTSVSLEKTKSTSAQRPTVRASRNACKLCTPLGACLAFSGVEGARTILHGSQGCATYIRRYMISHFKEPIDIASSSFGETSAIYGGRENLRQGLENVTRQYRPKLIGIATTCLAETIGDDVGMFLRELTADQSQVTEELPPMVHVSTPSYTGTHAEGYYAAVRALVEQLAEPANQDDHVNLFPGMFSPADLRHLSEICRDYDLPVTILPDYSETLDGPLWDSYQLIPEGGTTLSSIRSAPAATSSIEFSFTNDAQHTAGRYLADRFDVALHRLGAPIGVTQSDEFFDTLTCITGRPMPESHRRERGRLLDSLVDAHKVVFGKRAAVFGEEDLVVGIVALLADIGVVPALCASGGRSGRLRQALADVAPDVVDQIDVRDGVDFAEFDELLANHHIDLLIGNSKGHTIARQREVPLVRVGFPIHDRIGGARILHIGYRGAQALFDRITNALIEKAQRSSPVEYSYM